MNKSTLIKGTLIVIAIAVLGYALVKIDAVNTRLFRAQLVEGTKVSEFWNPLLTDTPCKDAVTGSAEQELVAPGADDWKLVTPDIPLNQNNQPQPEWYHNVLSDGGPSTYALFGAGDTITFKAPKQVVNGVELPVRHFQVMALPSGAVDGGEIFDIYLDPVCVTDIDILEPKTGRTIYPTTTAIEIEKVKVSLSNGIDYVYDDPGLINDMELAFLRNEEDVSSSNILLPTEHGSMSLLIEASGADNLSPNSPNLIPGLTTEPDLDKNVLRSSPILIGGKSCQDFQIAFIEGEGQGFFFGDPGDTLPEPSISRPFDFNKTSQSPIPAEADPIDFSTPVPEVATSEAVDFNTPAPVAAISDPVDFDAVTPTGASGSTISFSSPAISQVYLEYETTDPGLTNGSKPFTITINFEDQGAGGGTHDQVSTGPDYEYWVNNNSGNPVEIRNNFLLLFENNGYLEHLFSAQAVGFGVTLTAAEEGNYTNAYSGHYTVAGDDLTISFSGGTRGITSLNIRNENISEGGLTPGRDLFDITIDLVPGLATAYQVDTPGEYYSVQDNTDNRSVTIGNLISLFQNDPNLSQILVAESQNNVVTFRAKEKGEQGNGYEGFVTYDPPLAQQEFAFANGVKGMQSLLVKNEQDIGGALTAGRQPFSIQFNLIDGLAGNYDIGTPVSPNYIVNIKNDPDDREQTARNLVDGLTALNAAIASPLVQAIADSGEVTFQSVEKGEQGNYYNIEVSYDTQPDAEISFAGGAKGIQQIVVENQVATGTSIGSVPFSLTFNFIDGLDVDGDPATVNDYELLSGTPANPHYEFNIQNLPDDREQTASNLNEAINSLQWSPLTSEQVQGALEQIQLTAFEGGEHTNHYRGTVIHEMNPQGIVVSESPVTFSGGVAGVREPVESITLSYRNPDDFRKKAFQISVNFAPDVSVDPVNGINTNARLDRWTTENTFEITVRDEGDDTAKTASNFAYVFNSDLLGTESPFVAHIGPIGNSQVTLTTKELGEHTNHYLCSKNNQPFTFNPPAGKAQGECFDGGMNGTGKAASIITIPSVRQNVMAQGERSVIYARNGLGQIEWSTDDDSIVEVGQPKSESDTESTASFDEVVLPSSSASPQLAGAEVDATVERDEDGKVTGETADVKVRYTVTIPETDSAVNNLTASAIVDGEEVPITLEPFALTGELYGEGTYTHTAGLTITNMEGTLTGTIVGYATGEYKGSVKGTVEADMSATFKVLSPAIPGTVSSAHIENEGQLSGLRIGILKAAGDLTSTVKESDTDPNIYEHVYAKRAGTANIMAKDELCESIMTVQVLAQRLILEMVGRDPSESFEVGDTAQINAWVGVRGQKDEDQNVTQRVEWSSSNENVATIDDTGMLTALAPGDTNITARYSTEDPEIGDIWSEGVLTVHVTKLTGLTISLDESMIPQLSLENKNSAFKSVLLFINSPRAAGRSITMEGRRINIELPAGAATLTELEQIDLITDDLASKLAVTRDLGSGNIQPMVRVTTVPDFPGILVLEPINQDGDVDKNGLVHEVYENGIIDISTSASKEEISIVPGFKDGITLPASETYKLMAIAEYDDGTTRRLPATSVTWVNTPVNHLEQSYLDTGLLKFGEIAGTSTVQARFGEVTQGNVCQTNQAVCSNELTVTVQSGPSIEFARIIGPGSIEKGSRINIRARVSDIDTIENIKNITTSLVRSDFDTYEEINSCSPPACTWFDVTAFKDETVITDSSTPSEIEEEGTETAPPAPAALNYRTYRIPVKIPVYKELSDGLYKLILSISDAEGHTANEVIPIRIGKAASGDVNVDGKINMTDVLLAFQISNGRITPAYAQQNGLTIDFAAANFNNSDDGKVTFTDVLMLFRSLSNK